MLHERLKNINETLNDFKGENGEPCGLREIYILKSMWVMLLAEFEGSLKDLVENYIDKIKKNTPVEAMHVCLLLQNKYGGPHSDRTSFSIAEILNLFKGKNEITYRNFTKNKQPTYKKDSVEKLFNTLGIFLAEEELINLRQLDGIASTRDSIAHGDHQVNITCKELRENMGKILEVFNMLKNKLDVH